MKQNLPVYYGFTVILTAFSFFLFPFRESASIETLIGYPICVPIASNVNRSKHDF